MKRIIYSLYIDIPKEDLDYQPPYPGDDVPKTERTRLQFLEHYDKLKKSHLWYANYNNIDYRLFGYDSQYKNFYKWMKTNYPQVNEYCIVNFYKIHLLYELAKDYDEILLIGSGKGVTSVRTINELKWKRKNLKKFKFLSKQYNAVINKCNSYRF